MKKSVILALFAALVLKVFIFDFMVAQGESMMPGIKSGTVLVISRIRYGLRLPWKHKYLISWAQPRIGEVVVFYTPNGDLAVKRCVSVNENNEFIAEGDNLQLSHDSRSYGPVPIDNIIGKVLGCSANRGY
jgi:signal peptidase I